METKIKFYILILLHLPLLAYNQQGLPKNFKADKVEAGIALSGQLKSSKIMLKWLPSNLEILKLGHKYGFIIERAKYSSIIKDQFEKYKFNAIVGSPVFPWSKEKLEKFLNDNPNFVGSKDYENLALAYEISIGADTASSVRFSSNILEDKAKFSDAVNSQNYNYLTTLIAASFSNLAAESIGIFIEDTEIENGMQYVYKISLPNNKSKFNIIPGYVIVDQNKNNFRIANIKIKEGDQQISLLWDKMNEYLAYNIYMANNRTKKFEKVTNIPILNNRVQGYQQIQFNAFTKDSLINYIEYNFLVKGINIFGEEIEIGNAKGIPKDLTPPERPILEKVSQLAPNIAKIKWKQLADSMEVSGYKIYRSKSLNGNYIIIHDSVIPATWRSFKDSYFDKDTSNYYIVSAVDKYGNQSYSDPLYLTLIDSIPPKIPIFIAGKMDSLGIVTIKLKQQKEKDFMGYRLYKSNTPDHEFSIIRETFNDTIVANARNEILKDTTTLKTLTKYIFYKVTSLDYNYNESGYSEIIKIKRPDTIKPVAPLIYDVSVNERGINLLFNPSSSEDVISHNLYRKGTSENNWTFIARLGKNATMWLDTTYKENMKYEYVIYAIDDSELISEPSNSILAGGLLLPKKLINEIFVKNVGDKNFLEWTIYKNVPEPKYYLIYRSLNNGVFNYLGKVSQGKKTQFVDIAINSNVKYSYKILPDGGNYDYMISKIVEVTSANIK